MSDQAVNKDEAIGTLLRCLSDALRVMNEAVAMTPEKGPAVAIEYVADFLNDTDGIDEDMAAGFPDDWLTRWKVERAPIR